MFLHRGVDLVRAELRVLEELRERPDGPLADLQRSQHARKIFIGNLLAPAREPMRGEHSFQVRVRGDAGSTRTSFPAEILDRASDGWRELFLDTFSLAHLPCSRTAASDHDPGTAEHEEPAHRERQRPLEVRRPRGHRPRSGGSEPPPTALLPLLSEQLLAPLAKMPMPHRPGADSGC